MTVSEAARLRGFRRTYVLELVRGGHLSAEVLFGQLLVRRSEVGKMRKGRPGRKLGRAPVAAQCAAGDADS